MVGGSQLQQRNNGEIKMHLKTVLESVGFRYENDLVKFKGTLLFRLN